MHDRNADETQLREVWDPPSSSSRPKCTHAAGGEAAGGYLHVLVGVPVTVIDDDSVSRGEVDAQAASPGGQQEDEDVGVGVEGADGFLAVLPADAAINAAGLVALALQVRIQQVKHLGHLRSQRSHGLRADP